jgi:hypothetical protein
MPGKKTGLIFIYKSILVEMVINMFVYNNITDLNVSVKEISDIIQILHANKASEPDVICHKMLKLCSSKIALPPLEIN